MVTAPYVILKVRDQMSGGWTMRGYFAGAPVPADIDPDNLRHHVEGGMVKAVDEPQPEPVAEPEPAKPAKAVKAAG